MRIAVIGAGIVGVAVAHALIDEGHAVELVERDGIAAGASAGNAGWIAHMDILPLASPKAWRNLPRWAADPLGPLAIRPSYLPRLAPWFARFVAASRPARVEASTVALAALNALALPAWERRLAALGLEGQLRRSGILSVWASEARRRAADALVARQLAMGIAAEPLDAAELARLEPALGPHARAGVLYPAGCHVADPRTLTLALGRAAVARGAVLVQAQAVAIEPGETPALRLGGETRHFDAIVVAAGAWSKPLAGSAGDPIPLDTERGYNVTLPAGRLGIGRPIMFEGEGFVVTPLDTGDRAGGSVEFAGLDAPPNFARVDAMLTRLARFLPQADLTGGTRWMGFRPSIPDSLPVIGPARAGPRIIHAFGHGHYGLTQAAATAEIVADLLAGRGPAVAIAPYSPQRFAERF